jgi:hypothetical protein
MLTKQWQEKPFWDAVRDVCYKINYELWIDANGNVYFHEQGSRINSEEAIVHDSNLFETFQNSDDDGRKINKVVVYGAEIEGTQILYTDDRVGANEPERKKVVDDKDITSKEQASQVADTILTRNEDGATTRRVESALLASVEPGQEVNISDPQNGLDPDSYPVIRYIDVIDIKGGRIRTELVIDRDAGRVSTSISERVSTEESLKNTVRNQNDLDFSFNQRFNSVNGVLTRTEITQSLLKVIDGEGSGRWVSETEEAQSNVSAYQLDVRGEDLTSVTFKVSVNGGVDYKEVTPNTGNLVTPDETGDTLRIRVELEEGPVVDSIQLLYR